jgi:hypothetical protein
MNLLADRDRCKQDWAAIAQVDGGHDHQTGTQTPPAAGSKEDYAATARVVGFQGGLGSIITYES